MGSAKMPPYKPVPGRAGWVQQAREAQGLEQKELADLVGLSIGALRKMERGERNISDKRVKQFSEALNFPEQFFTQLRNHAQLEPVLDWINGEDVIECNTPGCPYVSTFLCDYPVGEGKTCDITLCEQHAIEQGSEWEDLHFCPQHSIIDREAVRGEE